MLVLHKDSDGGDIDDADRIPAASGHLRICLTRIRFKNNLPDLEINESRGCVVYYSLSFSQFFP